MLCHDYQSLLYRFKLSRTVKFRHYFSHPIHSRCYALCRVKNKPILYLHIQNWIFLVCRILQFVLQQCSNMELWHHHYHYGSLAIIMSLIEGRITRSKPKTLMKGKFPMKTIIRLIFWRLENRSFSLTSQGSVEYVPNPNDILKF